MSSKTHPVPVKTELEGGLVRYDFDIDHHATRLFKNLQSAQSTGSSLCDVTLVTTDGHEVLFHAILLAASSSIFRRQLAAQSKGVKKKIKVSMGVGVLKVIRDSIYTSKVTITPENVQGVKMAAKMYKLNFLQQICLRYDEKEESGEESEDESAEEGEKESEDEGEEVGDSTLGRSYHAKILSKVEELLTNGEFTTVTVKDVNGDGEFSCHAPLLAAASPVFHQMLSSEGSGSTLRLEGATHDAMEEILNFVYAASVVVGSDNAQALLMAACRYGLPEISQACCDWLSTNLDADNALGIYWLAQRMEGNYCDQLLAETKGFIMEHFMEVKESEDFEDLSPEELVEIIVDDQLNIDSEEDVVHAVMKWFSVDKAQRLQDLPTLLQCTRLEHTSLQFLETLLLNPDIAESQECITIIENAKESFSVEPATDPSITYGRRFDQFAQAPTPEWYHHDSDRGIEQEYFVELGPPTPDGTPDELPRRPRRVRKDGQPDMRFKENRDELLPSGRNQDGSLDKRTRECKEILKTTPKRMDGRPDMRFKVNRELLLGKSKGNNGTLDRRPAANREYGKKKDGTPDMRFKVNKEIQGKQTTPEAPLRTTGVPLKKDGTPDKRFKVNRKLFSDTAPVITPLASLPPRQPCGPRKKDGTPDMRYAVNKQVKGSAPSSRASLESCNRLAGPLKKDGTPDMRFAANRNRESRSGVGGSPSSASAWSATVAGPLKRDGTPDMRYAANKVLYGGSASIGVTSNHSGLMASSSYVPPGPLKRDGTPDMRYATNKVVYGSSGPSLSSGNSSSSSSSSSSSYSSSSTYKPSGPMKRDGTPDMRYAANKAYYGSSGLSRSSGSSYSSSSTYHASGPLKSDGTPDMRYKANR